MDTGGEEAAVAAVPDVPDGRPLAEQPAAGVRGARPAPARGHGRRQDGAGREGGGARHHARDRHLHHAPRQQGPGICVGTGVGTAVGISVGKDVGAAVNADTIRQFDVSLPSARGAASRFVQEHVTSSGEYPG